MKFKVWYIPQVPAEPVEVEWIEDVNTAIKVYGWMVKLSIYEFNNNIKLDYSDAGGIQFENENWDWEDIENEEKWEDWEDSLTF